MSTLCAPVCSSKHSPQSPEFLYVEFLILARPHIFLLKCPWVEPDRAHVRASEAKGSGAMHCCHHERPPPVRHRAVWRRSWRLEAGTASPERRAAAQANEGLYTLRLTWSSGRASEKRLSPNKDKQMRHLNLNTRL